MDDFERIEKQQFHIELKYICNNMVSFSSILGHSRAFEGIRGHSNLTDFIKIYECFNRILSEFVQETNQLRERMEP